MKTFNNKEQVISLTEVSEEMVKKLEDRSFMKWMDSVDVSKWKHLISDNTFLFDKCLKAHQVDHPDVDYYTFKEAMKKFCEQSNVEIIYPKNNCNQDQNLTNWAHNYRRD